MTYSRLLICLMCALPAMAGGQCAHLQIRRSLRQRHLFQHPGAWRQAQRTPPVAINPNIASSAVLSNRDSKQSGECAP